MSDEAAREVEYVVTFLEMTSPPRKSAPPPAGLGPHALMRVAEPPTHYFLYLYQTVGAAYHWTDMLALPTEAQDAFVSDPKVELFVLYRAGAPAGFFQLDFRTPETCDLAYFGLLPESVGRGVGSWLLSNAVEEAWAPTRSPAIALMSVNTCTLDHPSALAMYQRAGFAPVRRETRRRMVSG